MQNGQFGSKIKNAVNLEKINIRCGSRFLKRVGKG